MKFTLLPKTYSSYREPLIYEFDTQTAPADVEVRVVEATTGEVIGRKMLYGVSTARVDIAPFVRRAAEVKLPDKVEYSQISSQHIGVVTRDWLGQGIRRYLLLPRSVRQTVRTA